MDKKDVKAAPTVVCETPAAMRLTTIGEFISKNGSSFVERDFVHTTSSSVPSGTPFGALYAADKSEHGQVSDIMSGNVSFVYPGTPPPP